MITGELLRSSPLFASLPESELSSIASRAADVRLSEHEWLIQEGEVASFFVLIEGGLAVIKSIGGVPAQINTYAVGDFFGELPLLLGSASIAGLQALEPSRVARFEPHDFRELIVGSDALSGAVMQAMARRVGSLRELGSQAPAATVTVVGSRLDLVCHDLRDFLARNGVAYVWLDPSEPRAAERIADWGLPTDRLPLAVLADGSQLNAPTPRELANAVGLQTVPRADVYDVVIVGGGPAGLAAAVYGASEGLQTLLVERVAIGGQAGTSSRIENYLGFPSGLSGDDLSTRARQQAERFGAELVVARSVETLLPSAAAGEPHVARLDDGTEIAARAMVLAMGVSWRRLGVPGVEHFTGRGVFYGAARTEALSLRGKQVHIIGGGNSAGQAAILFSNYADQVVLLVRGRTLAASMSTYLTKELSSKANITVKLDSEVTACAGDQSLQSITVRDRDSNVEHEVKTQGLFVFIGASAETDWLGGGVQRDRLGFLCTGSRVKAENWPLPRDPMLLETSVPGIFAAGDVRSESIKRVASSVGEGSMSIAFVHQHLAESASTDRPA